jgi:hypothetical protein
MYVCMHVLILIRWWSFTGALSKRKAVHGWSWYMQCDGFRYIHACTVWVIMGRWRVGQERTWLIPCYEHVLEKLFFGYIFLNQYTNWLLSRPAFTSCVHTVSMCSTTAHRLVIALGHSSAAVVFRPLGFQCIHGITSMRQRAAAPPLGGSKYELNDHLSRLSDLGTHVVLRANTASKDSLRCLDRVSTNDLWACMFVVRSCYLHSVKFNDCMVC